MKARTGALPNSFFTASIFSAAASGRDEFLVGCRYLAGNPSRLLDCEELRIVRKRCEEYRVSLVHVGLGNRLEPPPGTGHGPDCSHVQPRCHILVELRDGRFADIVEPVGLAAVVADRVAVPVRDDGFHCVGREPATCLDRVDVDEEARPPAGPRSRSRTSFQHLLFERSYLPFKVLKEPL